MGTSSTAAIVCEMNVATTRPMASRLKSTFQIGMPCTMSWMSASSDSSRPLDVTALPSAMPPMARKTMVQRKLLKSSLVRIPVPKKSTMGTARSM
jgi:hypothetical protein